MKNTKQINVYAGTEEMYSLDGEVVRRSKFKKSIVDTNFFKTYLGEKMENEFELYPEEFTLADRKILDCICILMDDDNVAVVSANDLSHKLKLSMPTVYRALKLLVKHDYIQKKNAGSFLVNPERFSRSKAENRFAIKQEYLELLAKKRS